MPRPTVAAGVTSRIIEFAVERGANRSALLQQSGIDPAALDDFDARIPLTNHVSLIRAAKAQCDDPAFALHYGDAVNLAEVSVVGLIGYASANMLDAFVQLSRYSRVIVDLDLGLTARFTLEPDPRGLWIVDHRPLTDDLLELTEVAFAQMVNGTRRFGDTPFVIEVELSHEDPGYREEYERVLGAPVTFGSERNAMRIDPPWLSYPIAVQPRYVFGVLTRHADELLAQLDEPTMRQRVEQLIMPILHTGATDMKRVAADLGCSRDRLYRSLKAEEVTFVKVLDELRHSKALAYLGAGKLSVNEVAYLVGFSDRAAFTRAFRRWTGRTPGRVRSGSARPS